MGAAPARLAVLTSGGDAPGMNAAVRAVVRTALVRDIQPFVVHEGFRGLVDGGPAIVAASSRDVSNILQRGGTAIGTARSEEFRSTDGRRRSVANLLERGIDRLVVIGGDGSLTGADLLATEWPDHLRALVDEGVVTAATARAHPSLQLVGIVGSIDNDMFGTDMTIGADTALHRITEAVDAIHSTAASHQRSFVIEVMGRNCGYLALMAGLATGANWVFIPEHPPPADWEARLARTVRAGREIGRRQNIVMVAEGARDRDGAPIGSERIQEVLSEELGEDTRLTILGHVQRGGAPSAFDRVLATRCGYHAVEALADGRAADGPLLVGMRRHRITTVPLMDAVERTNELAGLLEAGRYDEAMESRGGSFAESWRTMRMLVRPTPAPQDRTTTPRRLALLHAGGLAPGMNTAVRAAVRAAMDRGHTVLGVAGGFPGLARGELTELTWMSVSGLVSHGGAELGTKRHVPSEEDLERMAEVIGEQRIDGLLMFGTLDGYIAADIVWAARDRFPGLDVPIVCLPMTVSNDLPATDQTVGSDTALNAITHDVDRIKQSAVASTRAFVVEVMGKQSGYLAVSAGLATGAERVYTPEEGITLEQLSKDVEALRERFAAGRRLGLLITGEGADGLYDTPFLAKLFEKEGGELFDVRQSVLGHVQQGGDPSPFDRIQATRLAVRCVHHLLETLDGPSPAAAMAGLTGGKVTFTPLSSFRSLLDPGGARRPAAQPWFHELQPIQRTMAGFSVG